MADKKGRIAQIIKKNLSEIIIYKQKDKICEFASIHKVDLSPDYSNCKVYVSHIQKDKVASLVNYLNSHASSIRTSLAKTLDIYKTPYLSFYADDFFEEENSIQKIIENLSKEKKKTLDDLN